MESLIVVDSDIFIDHFRGLQAATTDVNVMELFQGSSNRHELETIEQFLSLNRFIRLPLTRDPLCRTDVCLQLPSV